LRLLILLITGGREHPDLRWVEELMWETIDNALLDESFDVVELWHGGARGVDNVAAVAIEYADERPVKGKAFYARDYNSPTDRNQAMVNAARVHEAVLDSDGFDVEVTVRCLAFPGPKSAGTWDMIRRCKTAGFDTVVHRYPDPKQGVLL
jgi:hypothetical protein